MRTWGLSAPGKKWVAVGSTRVERQRLEGIITRDFSPFSVKHYEISFSTGLHARGTKCERVQAARRRLNERLTTATLRRPRLVHAVRTVINYEAASFRVLLRPRVAQCRVPLVVRRRRRRQRRWCRFRAAPPSFSCLTPWNVALFYVLFIFLCCSLIDVVIARCSFQHSLWRTLLSASRCLNLQLELWGVGGSLYVCIFKVQLNNKHI